MNCANHPDLPVAAYCQNCGKPLCSQCVRSVAGVVYCEPCLAMRLNPAAAGAGAGAAGSAAGASAGWTPVQGATGFSTQNRSFSGAPSPVLAGFLGTIPGVGAMYNGQFVKAFAHVVIFVVLVSISEHFDAAGLLVAAWVFYQIFDAVQTAIARREARPLPDPFGLNDLGQRLGVPGNSAAYAAAPPAPFPGSSNDAPPPSGQTAYTAPPSVDPSHPDFAAWTQRTAAENAFQDAGTPVAPGGGYQPLAPLPPAAYAGRPEPIGAIVLIGVGMLFLLSTLGVFQMDWIGRGWPVLIIALGAWLLFRRMRAAGPRTGGGL